MCERCRRPRRALRTRPMTACVPAAERCAPCRARSHPHSTTRCYRYASRVPGRMRHGLACYAKAPRFTPSQSRAAADKRGTLWSSPVSRAHRRVKDQHELKDESCGLCQERPRSCLASFQIPSFRSLHALVCSKWEFDCCTRTRLALMAEAWLAHAWLRWQVWLWRSNELTR